MNITYIILLKKGEKKNKKTTESIQLQVGDKIEYITYIDSIEESINKYISELSINENLCIILNGSILHNEYKDIILVYNEDVKTEDNKIEGEGLFLYMPIVELIEENSFKGFINTCIWKPYLASEMGILTNDLATKQIDLSLFSCLVSSNLLKKYPLNKNIKYYSHFEFFNRVTKDESFEIIGVPKVLMTETFVDQNLSKEEKIKYFQLAQQVE